MIPTMIPIFCAHKNRIKENGPVDGSEFLVKTVSPHLRKDLRDCDERIAKAANKLVLPTGLRLIALFCLGIGIPMLYAALLSVKHEREDLWVFLTAGIAFLAAAGVIAFWGLLRKRKMLNSREREDLAVAAEKARINAQKELGVPSTAETAEVLTFFYKIKHGRATPVYCDGGVFTLVEIRLWRDGQSLYAADLEQVYAFPLQSLRRLTGVEKTIYIDRIPLHRHYVLEIRHQGQDYGIYFPSYHLETVKKLTGLSTGNTLHL